VGVVYVRGCEVEGMLDENGRVIEEGPEPKPQLTGEKRTFRVLLDCNQYHADMVSIFFSSSSSRFSNCSFLFTALLTEIS
jgi:hypothetical protein